MSYSKGESSISEPFQAHTSTHGSWDEFLPPELTSRIFKLSLPDETLSSPRITESPLLLGRVCKRWRHIAYTSPELWSSLFLHVPELSSVSFVTLPVRAWLSRAGSYPLSLGLFASTLAPQIVMETIRLANVLLSYSSQCRYLQLQLGTISTGRLSNAEQLEFSEVGFPILETLNLASQVPVLKKSEFLARLLASAPLLRSLSLYNYPLVLSNPLTQLRCFKSNVEESVHGCIEILRLCPVLQECTFHFRITQGAVYSNPVVHSKLRQLDIRSTEFSQFFDAVSLPALHNLTLRGQDDNYGQYIDTVTPNMWKRSNFATFVARSMCTLEQLSFIDVIISKDDFISCLEVLSLTLTKLQFEGGQEGFLDEEILTRLTYQPSPDPTRPPFLCPKLDYIHIGKFALARYSSHLLDMLESRFYHDLPESSLARIRCAHVSGTFGPPQKRRLDKLKDDGMELHVTFEGNRFL